MDLNEREETIEDHLESFNADDDLLEKAVLVGGD